MDVWSSISPILDSDGAIVGTAIVAREVSALQQAYDRFEERVDQQRSETVDANCSPSPAATLSNRRSWT